MFDKFVELLDKVNYDSDNDQLVLLGDYIDRGPDSKKVLDLVIELVKDGAVALMGNHEFLLLESLNNTETCEFWFKYGGLDTMRSFVPEGWFGVLPYFEQPKLIPLEYIEFLSGLPAWAEIDEYIFVHAGLPKYAKHPSESSLYDLLWVREEWIRRPYRGKTVVFGHTPTFKLNYGYFVPWFGKNKICIDTGACYMNGKLTCLQLPSTVWQV